MANKISPTGELPAPAEEPAEKEGSEIIEWIEWEDHRADTVAQLAELKQTTIDLTSAYETLCRQHDELNDLVWNTFEEMDAKFDKLQASHAALEARVANLACLESRIEERLQYRLNAAVIARVDDQERIQERLQYRTNAALLARVADLETKIADLESRLEPQDGGL